MGRLSGSLPRCVTCRLETSLCLCARLGPRPARTRVVVVVHHKEWMKPTNSGHLVPRLVEGAEVRVRGRPGRPFSAEGLVEPARRTLLLYPGPAARPLDRALCAEDPRPVTLVVPDGNWRQAKKVAGREPELAGVQMVRLVDPEPTRFAIRRHRRGPDILGTLEAVALALSVLEGEAGPALEAELTDVFLAWVDRILFSRGKKTREQVWPAALTGGADR